MAQDASIAGQPAAAGLDGVAADWSGDKQVFPVPGAKADDVESFAQRHVHFHVLSHRLHARADVHHRNLADPSKVFALKIAGHDIPLLLIAIMTMVLITSSGTMGHGGELWLPAQPRQDHCPDARHGGWARASSAMQAFEWTKLIVHEGVRPWGNPMGAPQFGSAFS